MSDKQTTVTFGQMVADALSENPRHQRIADDRMVRTNHGANIRLDTADFIRLAIPYDAIDGEEKARQFDYPAQPTDVLFDLVMKLETREQKGTVPVGNLPTAQTIAESGQLSADTDPGTMSLDYAASRVATARSTYSLQVLLQDTSFGDYVESALRAAVRREIIRQVLIGDGTAPNAQGLSTLAGVHEATYATTGVAANDMTGVENALIDAKADGMALSWVVGSTLHTAMVDSAIEPGDYRRLVERHRVTLSDSMVYRSPDLPAGMALCLDLMNVALILHGEMLVTLNRVTRPGDLIVTARCPFDVHAIRAGQVARLTETP